MTSPPAMEVFLRREQPDLIDIATQLRELYQFSAGVRDFSPLLADWFLSSDQGKREALRYEAFDANGPTAAALAVLQQKHQDVADVRAISLWNGAQADAEAASLTSRVNALGRPDTVEFSLRVKPAIDEWQTPLAWLQLAIAIWRPRAAAFGPYWYSDHKTFEDRPGVGWMLYLPHILTQQQVPEARALVPVAGANQRQTGTIIVSVTDAPFSDDNTEHIRIANAIEVRLVDQDLLPKYKEL